MSPAFTEAFAALPRIGLVEGPSPLCKAPELAGRAGIGTLRLKRDDLFPALWGGTKVRKLDLLLAVEPFRSAPAWVVAGAVGSGQVAAVVAAGQRFSRPVHAHLFCTPLHAHGRENLAWTASHAAVLHAYRSQVDLALRAPGVVLGRSTGAGAVVPIGATSPRGMLGCVLGGIELAAQIATSPDPAPDAVYVALGSGGTAAGIAVGLALAGIDVPTQFRRGGRSSGGSSAGARARYPPTRSPSAASNPPNRNAKPAS